MLPLAAKEVFRLRSVGEAFDGAVGHLELTPDGTAAVAGFQQRVDRGVPGSDTVGEPLTPPWRVRLLAWRRRFVGLPLAIGDQDAKAMAVAGDSPLCGLPEVVPQMPAAADLRRLGCPGCGAFREERRAVPADNLDPRSLLQPCGQAERLPVRQQIHRPTGFDVDEHRAVDPSFACGVLINTNHPRDRDFGFGQCIEAARDQASNPNDGEAVAREAISLLAFRPVEEIVAAEQALWHLMVDSYTNPLWAAAYIVNSGCSDDGFDYFRGWLIAQGRETSERVIADPDALAELPIVQSSAANGVDLEGEDMLGIAWNAHISATGDQLPPSSSTIRYRELDPTWNFDFDDHDEMTRRLPRLAALYLE